MIRGRLVKLVVCGVRRLIRRACCLDASLLSSFLEVGTVGVVGEKMIVSRSLPSLTKTKSIVKFHRWLHVIELF